MSDMTDREMPTKPACNVLDYEHRGARAIRNHLQYCGSLTYHREGSPTVIPRWDYNLCACGTVFFIARTSGGLAACYWIYPSIEDLPGDMRPGASRG